MLKKSFLTRHFRNVKVTMVILKKSIKKYSRAVAAAATTELCCVGRAFTEG